MSNEVKEVQIPTIHLLNGASALHSDSEMVHSLRYACENIGFFYLKLDSSQLNPLLIQSVFEQSRNFFSLPTSIKEKIVDSELNRGYTSYQEETLDPSNQTEGDTKEGFYIARDVPVHDEAYNPSKLSGPNVWPTPAALTHGYEDNPDRSGAASFDCVLWKNIMNEYFDKLNSIGFQLVKLLALAIGLPSNYFDDKFSPPMAFLRLLHYPKQKSDPDNGIFACGAHSDYGMITLLATDDQPGLQILIDQEGNGDGCWVDVSPPPLGTFVVNLGDMLERWTNGRFRSTVHRVLSTGNFERYSIPFFYEPNFDTVVDCLDICIREGEKKKYAKTTAGGHLLEKYKETHADFEGGN